MIPTMHRQTVLALTIAALVTCAGTAGAQSGVQLTPDGRHTLISKDVGGQRWAILRSPDGTVTGNVFFPGGGDPQYVWCEETDETPAEGEVMLACFGADICPNAPCTNADWNFIAEVSLPETFFLPPSGSEWQTLTPLANGPRQEHPTLAFQNEIWVFGGFDGRARVVDTIEVYDPAANTWRDDVAPLPTPMHHANVAVVGDRIYVTGFLRAGSFTADGRVFEYDPALDRWSEKTSMPQARIRGASAVGVIDGKIYVAGGLRSGTRAEFSSYDPTTDQWETLPDLPRPIDHGASGVVDGVFYVLGGRDGGIAGVSEAVYAFDPAAGEWTRGADMPTPRGGVAGAVLGGKIYVLGGEGNPDTESGVFDEVEAYDPATDRWEELAPMATPRHGMGAAGFGGRIYVPGGAVRQAFGAVDTVDALQP